MKDQALTQIEAELVDFHNTEGGLIHSQADKEKLFSLGSIKSSRNHALATNEESKLNLKERQKGKGKNLEARK